ncbi:MAG: ABC-F type ribosomal protection protein [Tissierellaceae bacterium]|nr:ABC-F type ribosomal protection protein [Tissierellaceae bacterium]
MLLEIKNVSKSIGDRELLKDISFKLYKNDKVALIGKNGVGKTTLLKIITSQTEKDSGSVKINGRWGYLPQNLFLRNDKNFEYVNQIVNKSESYGRFLELLRKFELNGVENRPIETLSGGEKTKLYIIKLLLQNPDILIMDEPTNHLDYETIQWLENFIKNFKGAVFIVTHDRYFLNNTVSQIFELENKTIKEYSGNYTFYYNQKKEETERIKLEYHQYINKRKELEKAAREHMEKSKRYNNMSQNDFQRHKSAKVAKRSKAIISRIKNMEEKEKPFVPKNVNIKFKRDEEKTGDILIKGRKLSKSYDKVLFKDISFDLYKNKKVAIIGKNGVGKSTFLKGIIGKIKIDGEIYISPSAKIGYFSQELENLDMDMTVLDNLKRISFDESSIRNILGSLLFKGDDIYKKLWDLSYGEKVKVSFAEILLEKTNVLILDEPTNFLDIPTKEIIEDALSEYDGAILFVSHDRYFINKMAQEIWEISNEGFTKYEGGYNYYIDKKSWLNTSNSDINKKEELFKLEMELSYISFKISSCKEEKKTELERKYFDVVKKMKDIKEDLNK